MKEVIITFDNVALILKYILIRLRHHAITVHSSVKANGMLLAAIVNSTVPQFKMFTNDIDVEAEEIEYVLEFLAWFNNNKTSTNAIVRYVQASDGYTVTLNSGYTSLLQNLCENVLLLKQKEQTEFMDAINSSMFDSEIEIFIKISEIKQGFPGIIHHIDEYYEHSPIDKNGKHVALKKPSKTDILNKCKSLIEEKIPEYLKKLEYQNGGFKHALYEEVSHELIGIFGREDINKHFSKNGFDTKWNNIISKNTDYEKLKQKGRRQGS